MHKSLKILVSVCALSAFLLGTSTRADGEVNVYSFRQKFLLNLFFRLLKKKLASWSMWCLPKKV